MSPSSPFPISRMWPEAGCDPGSGIPDIGSAPVDAMSKRLRAAAREWEVTFDAVEAQMIVLDEDGRVRRMNRAARGLASLQSAETAMGVPLGAFGPEEPWRSLGAAHEESRRARRPVSRKVRDADADRSWFLSATPIAWDGVPWGTLLVARDMTAVDSLQDSLRQNETMTVLGRLVAGVAHEVRNPLFAISAIVDTWEQERRQGSETDPLIRSLRNEVARLNGLMRDLLDYSRPASLTWSAEPVRGVLEEVHSICAPHARTSGVILDYGIPAGLPELLMDRPRIVQVLQNLIDNAIRHTPRGGRVLAEASLEGEGSSRTVALRIRDEGPGFSDSALRRAFEPFFTERPTGTGLGLSIVERIVQQHGAKILIGNGPDRGAVVTIRFPFAEAGRNEAADTGTPALASAGDARW